MNAIADSAFDKPLAERRLDSFTLSIPQECATEFLLALFAEVRSHSEHVDNESTISWRDPSGLAHDFIQALQIIANDPIRFGHYMGEGSGWRVDGKLSNEQILVPLFDALPWTPPQLEVVYEAAIRGAMHPKLVAAVGDSGSLDTNDYYNRAPAELAKGFLALGYTARLRLVRLGGTPPSLDSFAFPSRKPLG